MSLDASISDEHAAQWQSIGQPTIPFGYKLVTGQAQRGDGIWDYSAGKFVKVKKEYPWGAPLKERIIIRKCEVVQTEIVGTETLETMEVE